MHRTRLKVVLFNSLSLVSKSFRSLLASPELYKARSLLGCTERCLYVSFRHFGEYLWYTLCLKPNQTLTNDTSQNMSSGYALAPVPIPHSPPANVRGLVAVGSNVYNIGSDHTWHEGPSLHVELLKNSASVLDEKINVAGFYKDGHYSLKSSFEVFDTRTQIWDPKPIPYTGTRDTLSNTSACIDGKFLVRVVGEVFAYDPKEGGRWDMLEDCDMWPHTVSDSSSCVIENVLYHAFHEKDRVHGGFRWYDAKGNKWRDLKGLVGLPKFPY